MDIFFTQSSLNNFFGEIYYLADVWLNTIAIKSALFIKLMPAKNESETHTKCCPVTWPQHFSWKAQAFH